MATVMISRALLQSIYDRVNKARDMEQRAECPMLYAPTALDISSLYNYLCWGDHLELLSQIPKDWLTPATDAFLVLTDQETSAAARVHFTGLQSAYHRPVRATGYYYSSPQVEVTSELLESLLYLPGAQECLNALQQVRRQRELQVKYDALWEQLNTFLARCKSLNEAVKIMPSIRLYLEPDYIERLERKVERAKFASTRADELLEGVDVDAVTGLGAAALLSGSS